MSRKYAIYGGTFDPIHSGHMALAEAAVRECGIDRLIFMPDYVSPFKQGKKTAPAEDRLNMIKAAVCGRPGFSVSGYEISREGPSYTVETLRHWSSIIEGELYFVLGFDSAVEVDSWHEGGEILRNYPLITAKRPGTDDAEGLARIEFFRKAYNANIKVLSMEPVDASSTRIRELIKEGKPITGLVPAETEAYIYDHELYRQ